MGYRIGDIDYEVSFEDFSKEENYNHRHFWIKDKNGKGWRFSVIYLIEDGEIKDCQYLESGLDKFHRETIFEQSLNQPDTLSIV